MTSTAPLLMEALLVSFKVAGWAMVCAFPVGLGLAWLLARKQFIGKPLVETLIMMPLVLPPTAIGYLLVLTLQRRGLLGADTLGFDLDLLLTWKGAVVAAAIMSLPLVTRTARVAFEEVSPRLELMGRSLGLSRARSFTHVSLPLARRGLLAAFVLGFGRALGEFGATVIVAGNIPGKTQTLSLAIFDSYQLGQDGRVLQLVGVTAVIAFVLAFAVERLLARTPGGGGQR
jgi:molybdate transport system permease protein